MLELKDKIVDFVKKNGPVLPTQISKSLESNTMFAGAFLSDLVSTKEILVTNARIGSSPLYYVKGQEPKLQMLKEYLPMREKEAFDILKNKRIILESQVEPSHRVALRNMKDFASLITTNIQGKTNNFWKWYLVSNEEAQKTIYELLNISTPQEIRKIEEPKVLQKKEVIQEKPKHVQEIQQVIKPKRIKTKKSKENLFLKEAQSYFSKKNITILEQEVIRKDSDIEFIVTIPSSLRNLKYFVKTKNKKRINDTDLIVAATKAKDKNLPCLFITEGKLTKKATAYYEKNLKGSLNIINF